MKVKCPVCGKNGSLALKWVLNNQKAKYTYYYVAHHDASGVTWCYIGKDLYSGEAESKENNSEEESEALVPE